MKTASFRWVVAATAAVAQPLACAGEDSGSDRAGSDDELAQTSGTTAAETPEASPAAAPAPSPVASPVAPASSPLATPAAPAPAATSDGAPTAVAAAVFDQPDGAVAEPSDAGADSDYQNEEPDPYPGCMRG